MRPALRTSLACAAAAASGLFFAGHWYLDGSLSYLRDISITEPATHAGGLLASGRLKEAQDYAEFCLALPGIGPAQAERLALVRDRALAGRSTAGYRAAEIARGFFLGDSDESYGRGARLVSDLTLVGDIRDLAKSGLDYASGREVDPFIVALSAIGLAISATALTPLAPAAGAGEPVALLKAARRAGAVSARMEKEVAGIASRVVKGGGREAARGLEAPLRELVRTEKALGMDAAIAVLRRSDSLEDVARSARAAEKFGTEAAAIFRYGGRDVVAAAEAAGPAAVRGAVRYGEDAVSLLTKVPARRLLADLARLTRVAASRTLRILAVIAGIAGWAAAALAAFLAAAGLFTGLLWRLSRLALRLARRRSC